MRLAIQRKQERCSVMVGMWCMCVPPIQSPNMQRSRLMRRLMPQPRLMRTGTGGRMMAKMHSRMSTRVAIVGEEGGGCRVVALSSE
jgi:hypothetical protein